jgi:hypothetical protein
MECIQLEDPPRIRRPPGQWTNRPGKYSRLVGQHQAFDREVATQRHQSLAGRLARLWKPRLRAKQRDCCFQSKRDNCRSLAIQHFQEVALEVAGQFQSPKMRRILASQRFDRCLRRTELNPTTDSHVVEDLQQPVQLGFGKF